MLFALSRRPTDCGFDVHAASTNVHRAISEALRSSRSRIAVLAVWVTTSAHPKSAVLTVENTGEKLTPAVGRHARRAVSARH
jgi:hypothetical protein